MRAARVLSGWIGVADVEGLSIWVQTSCRQRVAIEMDVSEGGIHHNVLDGVVDDACAIAIGSDLELID